MNTLGLYEAHLDVSDLRTSIDFYTKKLGFRLAFRDPERRIAFLWVSQGKRHMIGLWEKEEIHRGHVAFSVTPEEIERVAAFLQERGIVSRDFFGNPGSRALRSRLDARRIGIFQGPGRAQPRVYRPFAG
ncbi:VOC family protein [Planifilum fimeticola]